MQQLQAVAPERLLTVVALGSHHALPREPGISGLWAFSGQLYDTIFASTAAHFRGCMHFPTELLRGTEWPCPVIRVDNVVKILNTFCHQAANPVTNHTVQAAHTDPAKDAIDTFLPSGSSHTTVNLNCLGNEDRYRLLGWTSRLAAAVHRPNQLYSHIRAHHLGRFHAFGIINTTPAIGLSRLVPSASLSSHSAFRRGFTLFEVAISLLLLSFAILSTLMLFPIGLKAQEQARFQIYAATKAEEMVEAFTSTSNANPSIDTEGPNLWETAGGYRSQAWDLEARVSSHRFGIMPVPSQIVSRIDSDNDEIQNILSQGGYIYYSQALATTETEEQGAPRNPPNDAMKLIFAVSGYAQQNCLHFLALKNWPYYTPYPSPPLHVSHVPDLSLPRPNALPSPGYWSWYGWPWGGQAEDYTICSESLPANLDLDMQKLFDYPVQTPSGLVHIGYFPYLYGSQWSNGNGASIYPDGWNPPTINQPGVPANYNSNPTALGAIGYAQAALWYFQKKLPGVSLTGLSGTSYVHGAFVNNVETSQWQEVQAYRYLSHALTCLTAWFSISDATNPNGDLTRGISIPQISIDGVMSPTFTLTDAYLRPIEERAIYLIMQFSAMYPYDWACPRPMQRTINMDYPLIMSDMWSQPTTGTIFGTGPPDSSPLTQAAQWRPVSAEPIQHIGVSQSYPLVALDAQMGNGSPGPLFGDVNHYTLAVPFRAAERCREIVFWSADWQSYQDFETAPSAPVDASKYPLSAPRGNTQPTAGNLPCVTMHGFVNANNGSRMWDVQFRDEQQWAFRNPEKCELFIQSMLNSPTGLVTGTAATGSGSGGGNINLEIQNNPWSQAPDAGPSQQAESVFSGLYGADRNYNLKLDRGPVPPSVRLRAVTVARFNFYDPRIQCLLH